MKIRILPVASQSGGLLGYRVICNATCVAAIGMPSTQSELQDAFVAVALAALAESVAETVEREP